MSNYIGIDLGTTNSAVSILDETGRPVIVHNIDGDNITPSVVSFSTAKKIMVGKEAKRNRGEVNTFSGFKRYMGTKEEYECYGATHTPMSLSAIVLKKLKEDFESTIGKIKEAVVTIPANFSNEAREDTMAAAKKAGLEVKYIINEPTAAAVYYAHQTGSKLDGKYAIYDLGGGTFDISIINVKDNDIEVLSTEGVSKLGGDDFDKALQELVAKKYKKETGKELDFEDYDLNDVEEDKKSLSSREKINIKISSEGGRANIEVTRKEFESSISTLMAQTEMLCENALDDANLKTKDIVEVFLVGGSSRIPCVQKSIKNVFKKEPIALVNPDEAVALGASLYAAYKSDGESLNSVQRKTVAAMNVKEITSKFFGTVALGLSESKGTEELINSVIIKKGESIPCEKSEKFYTISDGQTAVGCEITESEINETDLKFVKVIWKGELQLPAGRPAGQEIIITFSYDENQTMKCSFVDVETNKKTEVDLTVGKNNKADDIDIDKFMVE